MSAPTRWPGLVAAALLSGCVATVRPPAAPRDPTTAYLLLNALHSGIALPRGADALVVYGYGDWDWYVREENAWYRAFDTLLWPTQGALGRRILAAPAAPGADVLQRTYPGARVFALEVARADAVALRDLLDARFAAAPSSYFDPAYDMTFVEHDEPFWFVHSCHDETAEWLRWLGCEVEGAPIRRALRPAPPG